MIQVFKCPSCGSTLSDEGGAEPTITCQFCGSTVIVPEELRPKPEAAPASSEPSSTLLSSALELGEALTGLPLDKLAELKRLISSGQKIEAVKLYREITGVGLKEAKDAVEAMEAGRPVVITRAAATTNARYEAADDLSPAVRLREVMALIQSGQKIEAIKLYREITGVGLKEAKDAVEAMEAGQPVTVANFKLETPAVTDASQDPRVGEMVQLIYDNRKIEAIKLYREIFDTGLKEAKDAVEAIAAGQSAEAARAMAHQAAVAAAKASRPVLRPTTSRPRSAAATGCGCALLIFGFVMAMVFGGPFRLSGSYRQALAAAQADPQVVAALGAPVEASWWPITGSLSCGGNGCLADYRIPIHGAKKSGQIVVESNSKDSFIGLGGTWTLDAYVVVDSGPTLELTPPPTPAPTLSAAQVDATSGAISRATAAVQATRDAQSTATEEAKQNATATAGVEATRAAAAEAAATAQAQSLATSIAATQAAWSVAISETFQDNNRQWPVGLHQDNSLGADIKIPDGQYAWTVNVRRGNSYLNFIPKDAPQFGDFYAAVDVKLLGGGEGGNYAYGLIFRHLNDDYGFFGIQADGSFRVLTVFGTGIYQMILSSSPAIRPNAVNRIAVRGVGSDFVCEINGEMVHIVTEDFVPGDIGLGVDAISSAGEARVVFDNFEVRAPGGENQ